MALVLDGNGSMALGNGYITGISAGALPASVIGSGAVIQTVVGPSSFTETNINTRDTWTDCISVAITPSRSTSKVLVLVNNYMLSYTGGTAGVVWAQTRITRNGTVVHQKEYEGGNSGAYYYHRNVDPTYIFLDNPDTASIVTYKFQARLPTTSNGQTLQNTLLRTKFGATDGVGGGYVALMEIAQ